MSDRDSKKAELVNLFSEVKTPSAPRKPRVSRAQPATSAGGNVINLFGNGLRRNRSPAVTSTTLSPFPGRRAKKSSSRQGRA